jgi:hypothetical protein
MYAHTMDNESEPEVVISIRKALLHESWIHFFRAGMCIILSILSLFVSDQLFFFAIPMVLVIVFMPLQLMFPKNVKSMNG